MADIFTHIANFAHRVYANIADKTDKFSVREVLKNETKSLNSLAKKSIFHFPVIASDSCGNEILMKLTSFIERKNAILIKLIIQRVGTIDLSNKDSKDLIIKRLKGFDMGYINDSQDFTNDDHIKDIIKTSKSYSNTEHTHSPAIRMLMNERKNEESNMLEDGEIIGLVKPKKSDFLNEADCAYRSLWREAAAHRQIGVAEGGLQ